MENRDSVVRKTLLKAAFSLTWGTCHHRAASRNFQKSRISRKHYRDKFCFGPLFTPFELASEKLLLVERLDEILDNVQML